jgi:ABC-type antimicrobial peptide transport system permease subunit
MALGAGRDRIWTMVVREGLVLGLLGGALGIASAWGGARLLATFLYGTAPTDPLSFALSTVAVVAVAVTASLVPAVRASRTDPLITLRAE